MLYSLRSESNTFTHELKFIHQRLKTKIFVFVSHGVINIILE